MPILPPLPRPQRRRIHKIIHVTRRILFFERKHGTHLIDGYGCA
ncbi:hypothetical protein [Aeromonas salmonicida]|nr:hypothetical protein [Aeromonas salmonicida]